eukprot:scaffold235876_cov19-Tisochrysis_lutea.AAC.3
MFCSQAVSRSKTRGENTEEPVQKHLHRSTCTKAPSKTRKRKGRKHCRQESEGSVASDYEKLVEPALLDTE